MWHFAPCPPSFFYSDVIKSSRVYHQFVPKGTSTKMLPSHGVLLTTQIESREHSHQDCHIEYPDTEHKYWWCTFNRGSSTHLPLTLSNLSPLYLVYIFMCPRPPNNPVYGRNLDPSVLSFSLSLHWHPYWYICIPFRSRFIYYIINTHHPSFTFFLKVSMILRLISKHDFKLDFDDFPCSSKGDLFLPWLSNFVQ